MMTFDTRLLVTLPRIGFFIQKFYALQSADPVSSFAPGIKCQMLSIVDDQQ